MCVFECARVCVCVRARVVLFLGLNGSVSFPAAFRVLPFCMVSCPLRDGGMCDLALNDDDGNMVRRQEKKMEERITSPPSPYFFFLLFKYVVVHFLCLLSFM